MSEWSGECDGGGGGGGGNFDKNDFGEKPLEPRKSVAQKVVLLDHGVVDRFAGHRTYYVPQKMTFVDPRTGPMLVKSRQTKPSSNIVTRFLGGRKKHALDIEPPRQLTQLLC